MNKIYKPLIASLLAGISTLQAQQPVPASIQTKPMAFVGGIAHIGNGKVINNSIITIENGKITSITDANLAKPDNTKFDVMNIPGKHIYPGFIAANSLLGLTEIEAARATNDYNEVGAVNPNVRAIIAYNTDSKVTPTVRYNGVLLAQVTPQGGTVSGESSVVELDGWNWEDAAYKMDDGIHLNWPSMMTVRAWWAQPEDAQKERADKEMQAIRSLFRDAKAYDKSEITEKNLKFEAMRGLFNNTKKLYIHTDYVKEIIAAVNFCKEFGVKMVLVGGADAWMATDILKDNDIPVIIGRTHALPGKEDDDVDLPYKLPALLQKAGILCAISVDGFWQERNLAFNAGTAAAYGLDKEQALATITGNTAKILGIDATVGTLETGKDATLIISTGDALDMRTNNIEQAYIRGKKIDLNNIQKGLYNKYKTKYGLK